MPHTLPPYPRVNTEKIQRLKAAMNTQNRDQGSGTRDQGCCSYYGVAYETNSSNSNNNPPTSEAKLKKL